MLLARRPVLISLVPVLLTCLGCSYAVAQDSLPAAAVPDQLQQQSGRIQPGDQVVLNIWREPDLSGTFTVDDAGDVTIPRVGTVRATEYTGEALQRTVRDELSRGGYRHLTRLEVEVEENYGQSATYSEVLASD